MKILLPATVATFLALTPALAQAKDGWFLSAAVGTAELEERFDGFDVDADSTAYRMTIGWRLNQYLSLEGGYHNFGRFDQDVVVSGTPTTVSLKADGFVLGGSATLPLAGQLGLFARAGSFFWDGDAKINDVTAASPGDTNFYFGAGLRLGLGDRWSLFVDGSRYDLDGADSNILSIGAEIRFP